MRLQALRAPGAARDPASPASALYQRDEAETWEHMALTRARVVAGDASLAREIAGDGARDADAQARAGEGRRGDARRCAR